MDKKELLRVINQAADEGATKLGLSSIDITELPPEIGNLTNLTRLNLQGNQLTTLPPEIGNLTNLTHLYLQGNQLTSLPPEIGNLTNLTDLDLNKNKLASLPSEFGNLTNLKHLNIHSCQLTSLPSELCNLTKLTFLDIDNNQLTSLPSEIGNLTNLTGLWFDNNQLTSLPSELGNLTNLTKLDLLGNRLTSLPPELGKLTKLTRLNLFYNQLTSLPSELGNLPDSLEIKLDGNPLEQPPLEIAEKGIPAIREYFRSLEVEEKLPLNEVKVLLVGDGGAGKTSLVKRLLWDKFSKSERQTQGINIEPWRIKLDGRKVKANIWDFGGQQVMHATHQFFLSKRALYVLVLDGRKDEEPEYWLKQIESFGGDSPILIVINKIDENPSHDVNRIFLREKYKGIVGFVRVSCATSRGIGVFDKALRRAMLKVEMMKTTWPKSWFDIKTRLEKLETDYISYDEYRDICGKEDVKQEIGQDTLADFLHDLGVVLHFRDFELDQTNVLDPEWVTGAVYRIINSPKVAAAKGLLDLSALVGILRRRNKKDYLYPRDMHSYIVHLMKKFELCYDVENDTVLIPDLLDVQQPEFDFDYDGCLRFVLKYDFLPKSVLPRFIVKMHKDIKGDLRWRTGLVMEDKDFGSTAFAIADHQAKKISLYISGDLKRDYFAVILSALREINGSFEKLSVDERVPMPDQPDVSVSYEHLLRLEKMGEDKYVPEGSEKSYEVKKLLGSIQLGSKTDDEMLYILQKIYKQTGDKKSFTRRIMGIPQIPFVNAGELTDLIEWAWNRLHRNKEK